MIELLICCTCLVFTAIWLVGRCQKKQDVKNKPNQTRSLGNIEQLLLNVGSLGAKHIVRTVIFSSERPISLQSVEIAMGRLAERHPLLRMKVKRSISNDNDWFIPMNKMEVKIEELPDRSWLDVMEQQLSYAGINVEEGPLWHVKFLPNINIEDTHVKLPHQYALIYLSLIMPYVMITHCYA